MITRSLESKLGELYTKFPVLFVTGPRQSGKTTLIKKVFGDLPYVSLEDIDTRNLAIQDPRGFLSNYPKGAVLDEVQRTPELFSYIQGIVDSTETKFILSGSQNFLVLDAISQSLAGRAAILTLLPLSLRELAQEKIYFDQYENAIFTGFYPRIIDRKINPVDFYPSYISTYVERDIRHIQNIENMATFGNFVQLCAGRIGSLVNYQSLATDAGISPNTAKAWLNLLEATYIIHLLQPYRKNFNKRIIKSPKLYFYDTGLACSLLRIESVEQLATHYLKGGLFENMVINEFLKFRTNQGARSNMYFWQSKDKKEIDLVIDRGDTVLPFEIKSSKTKRTNLLDNLKVWQKLTGTSTENLSLIYGGEENFISSDGTFLSWKFLEKEAFY